MIIATFSSGIKISFEHGKVKVLTEVSPNLEDALLGAVEYARKTMNNQPSTFDYDTALAFELASALGLGEPQIERIGEEEEDDFNQRIY